MVYTNMLYALALDRVVFGVTPGWWSLAGSALIFGGAVWVAVSKQRGAAKEVVEVGREDEEMGMLRRDGSREGGGEAGEDVGIEPERRLDGEESDLFSRRD